MRLLTLLLLLAYAQPVRAAEDPKEEARRHFEAASRQYERGALEGALAEYEAAHRAMPLPAFLFNMAQCHRRLGHYARAAELYARYLEEEPDPPNRILAEELLAESRQQAALTSTQACPEVAPEPLYARWWFWTILGTAVVAGAVGVGLAVRPEGP